MNNILSDSKIDQINKADSKAVMSLFSEVTTDTQFNKRKAERVGVNNRMLLLAATTPEVYGRAADGVPVYIRPASKGWANSEINQKVHKDYPNIITTTKAGYMSGIEISGDNETANKDINNFMKANNFDTAHSDLVSKTSGYGVKAVRLFSDDINGIAFGEIEPWDYAPFYDKTGRLVFVMQWTETSERIKQDFGVGGYKVNLLTASEDMYFWTTTKNDDVTPNSQEYPAIVGTVEDQAPGRRNHSFKGVPVVEFWNNRQQLGDVEKTLDAQDARDEISSKCITGMTAFSDVILVDETEDDGQQPEISKEDFKNMTKQLRDFGKLDGKWKWLIKDYAGYEAVSKELIRLEQDIYEGSSSYNPNSMSGDGSSPTKYQVQQKLKGLIDSAVKTEQQFKKSYMEMFRLILTHGVAKENSTEYLDINITFKHTIPEDKMATLKMLFEMGVPISPETGYTEAGYKWDEEKLKLIDAKSDVLTALNEENDING